MNESELFQNYASHTNGKHLIAKTIIKSVSYLPNNILDIGAGNGAITEYLSKWAKEIVAIEPSASLAKEITNRNLSNVEVIQTRIQDVKINKPYDLILMSYFLDVIDQSAWLEILNTIHQKCPNTPILCVTYLEGCPWDIFSQLIKKKIGTKRTGGYTTIIPAIRNLGWDINMMKMINTKIYGQTTQELYKILEFFYKDVLYEYQSTQSYLIKQLKKLANNNGTSIRVTEILFELLPDGRLPAIVS